MTAEQEVAQVPAENAELREQLAVALARIIELEAQLNQRGDPPAFVKPDWQKAQAPAAPRKK